MPINWPVKMSVLKLIWLCFLIFLIADFICELESLDQSSDGACVVRLSSREPRKKSYAATISKMCGRRKCVVRRYKTEYTVVWNNHTVCCTGWQHKEDLDICEPICSTGCLGGKCIDANVCHCEPPLHLDPDRLNACVPYVCDPPCENSQCWGNNTCKCLPSFQRFNSTHCAKCDEGYIVDSDLNCTPKCVNDCVNGNCTAPNTCTCFEGYKQKDTFTCQPKCECYNGVCVAPYNCSCFEGYVKENSTHCVPKCDACENGVCFAPNNCTCRDGYTKIDGVCKAKCSKSCVNGFCSAPNVCTCNEGYMSNDSNSDVCFKPCGDCKGVCDLHGVCKTGLCNITTT